MKTTVRSGLLLALLAMVTALTVVNCTAATGTKTKTSSQVSGLRSLPADFFTRKAVCYSGIRTSSSSDAPTQANVDQDLTLMNQAGYTLLRLYSSGSTSELVLQEIAALGLDMKVQLGVWMTSSDNSTEINNGIRLATTYPSIVEAVSIGNETQVSWTGNPVPAATLIAAIGQVRAAIAQPVTTDDNWAVFADSNGSTSSGVGTGSYSTKLILGAIDYVAMHTYPFADAQYNLWDYKQTDAATTANASGYPARADAMMQAAITSDASVNYAAVRSYMTSNGFSALPVVIGETGWKALVTDSSDPAEQTLAFPVNQAMYIANLSNAALWTSGAPKNVFYFEAFDEPWKGGDDGWGLFDVNRHARYALYDKFPVTTNVAVSSSTGTVEVPANESVLDDSLTYAKTDALYYVQPAANGTVTKANYVSFADNMTASSDTAVPTITPQWFGWDSNPATASGGKATGGSVPNGDSGYMKITTAPKSWGWGFFEHLDTTAMDDLSNFGNGHLHFYLRTTYPGKLLVGYATGSGPDGESYTTLSNGDGSGFVNDGSWHLVTLTISSLTYNGSGLPNRALVSWPFFVADVFATSTGIGGYVGTGDTQTATNNQEIDVADIYWTQN